MSMLISLLTSCTWRSETDIYAVAKVVDGLQSAESEGRSPPAVRLAQSLLGVVRLQI